jgi:hypothetical protein
MLTVFSDVDSGIAVVVLDIKQQVTEALRVDVDPRCTRLHKYYLLN